MKLAIIYTVLAVFSTLINIGAQAISLLIYSGEFNLWLAIIFGTGAGLVSKYYLDKKYIFDVAPSSGAKDASLFLLYSATGVITTFVFWGFEWGFDYLFNSIPMRYLGAVIGLSIGYIIKYQLDKKFVFAGVQKL
ncbi:MAG: putative flippase GtrA [Oceanospirillaceae bacterium]|jgi:putative flippase GtrA